MSILSYLYSESYVCIVTSYSNTFLTDPPRIRLRVTRMLIVSCFLHHNYSIDVFINPSHDVVHWPFINSTTVRLFGLFVMLGLSKQCWLRKGLS